MTEEELKQAAIELCKIRGIDPYEELKGASQPDINGVVYDICVIDPRWAWVKDEIKNHYEIQTAIQMGKYASRMNFEEMVRAAREKAENDE